MRITTFSLMFMMFMATFTAGIKQDTYICTIRGKVVDVKGNPVSLATVYAETTGPIIGIVPHVETGKNGEFVIEHLQPGTYHLYAIKGYEQYSQQSGSFFTNDLTPLVKVTTQSPMVEIGLQLRPPAGALNISVTDANSTCPINPSFDIRRTDEPKRSIGGSMPSKWVLVVPPDIKVSLRVGAAGYKDWYYPGGNNPKHATSIRLKSGEEITLNIKLESISPINCVTD